MIDILNYILQGHESGGSSGHEQDCSGYQGGLDIIYIPRPFSVPKEAWEERG